MEAVGLLRAEVLSAATSRAAAIGRADLTGVLVPEFRGRPHRRGRRPQPGPDRPARPAPIGGLPRKIAAGEQGLLRIFPFARYGVRGAVRRPVVRGRVRDARGRSGVMGRWRLGLLFSCCL